MVFNTLNRLRWTGKLASSAVTILHRGARDNKKTIYGNQITLVKKRYFYYTDGCREIHIPNHRVLEIRMEEEIIWKKTEKG
ncbi:MAG: DUF504 domain-containing protein [Candidatus Aenigmarchaeota archaeon]|nr:DUF504 domain-containing protein [Candidatus Aenigmarchaeota archaeon]